MKTIFKIKDKTGRSISLSEDRWKHIIMTHSEIGSYLEEIKQCLINPLKITPHEKGDLRNYYLYIKHRKHPEKFLKIIVKYLNARGIVITTHFVRQIR